MTGRRRALLSATTLALLGLDLVAWAAVVSERTGTLPEVQEILGLWFRILYDGSLATALIAILLAATIVLRAGRSPAAQSLAIAMAGSGYTILVFLATLVVEPDSTSWLAAAAWSMSPFVPAVLVVGVAAFIRFGMLFPRPLTADDLKRLGALKPDDSMNRASRATASWFRRLARRPQAAAKPPERPRLLDRLARKLPPGLRRLANHTVISEPGQGLTRPRRFWGWVLVWAALPYLTVWIGEGVPAALGIEIRGGHPWAWVMIVVLFVWVIALFFAVALGLNLLRLGYALAAPADRRRVRWIIEGFNAAGWGCLAMVPFFVAARLGVENIIVEVFPGVYFGIFPLFILTGIALAIFYEGALEPSLVVRRSTIYGLFGFGLAFLFAIVEEMVTALLTERLGLPDGTGTLAASGFIAAVIGGFYGRFHRTVAAYLEGSTARAADQATATRGRSGSPAT